MYIARRVVQNRTAWLWSWSCRCGQRAQCTGERCAGYGICVACGMSRPHTLYRYPVPQFESAAGFPATYGLHYHRHDALRNLFATKFTSYGWEKLGHRPGARVPCNLASCRLRTCFHSLLVLTYRIDMKQDMPIAV